MTQASLTDSHPYPELPSLGSGVTLLKTPHPRSVATHHLALDVIQETDGIAYWLDARNTASTYALNEVTPHRRLLRRIRIARAFTAYQHFVLVRRLINTVSPRTACLVVPNLDSLYRDEDIPDFEAVPMLEAVVSALAQIAETYKIRILVTTTQSDELAEVVRDEATAEYQCEETPLGYRFTGEGFETTAYWDKTGWQTTIPYWVELVGAVDDSPTVECPGTITPATLGGA